MKRVQANGRIEYVPSHRLLGVNVKENRALARQRSVSSMSPRAQTDCSFYVSFHDGTQLVKVEVEPMWREPGHMQSGLQHPVFEALLGPHILHFKPTHYYWGLCYEILRRVTTTSLVLLVQSPMVLNAPRYDVVYALVASALSLMVQAQVKPYCKPAINLIQTLIIGSQALSIIVFTTEKYANTNIAQSDACGWILVAIHSILLLFIGYRITQDFIPWIQTYFPAGYAKALTSCCSACQNWMSWARTAAGKCRLNSGGTQQEHAF